MSAQWLGFLIYILVQTCDTFRTKVATKTFQTSSASSAEGSRGVEEVLQRSGACCCKQEKCSPDAKGSPTQVIAPSGQMQGQVLCCKERDKCQRGHGYKHNANDTFTDNFLDATCRLTDDWCDRSTKCVHGTIHVQKEGFKQSCECQCDAGYDSNCDTCIMGYERAYDGRCKESGVYWPVEGGEQVLTHAGNLSLGIGAHEPGVWHVIAPDRGATLHDVSQGQLGTCYLLAAMASVAFHSPDVIKKMFEKMQHTWEWKDPVYVTNWFMDGKPTEVAVSEELPVNPKLGRPFFTRV